MHFDIDEHRKLKCVEVKKKIKHGEYRFFILNL